MKAFSVLITLFLLRSNHNFAANQTKIVADCKKFNHRQKKDDSEKMKDNRKPNDGRNCNHGWKSTHEKTTQLQSCMQLAAS